MENNIKEQLDDILSQYGGESGNLISILQEAQERFGYLSEGVMAGIEIRLPLSPPYCDKISWGKW